jgi:predicted ATPase
MIERLAIGGYRSLRDVRLELGALTLVTGANGSGKSSLYRALRLLADVAQGRLVASLAADGGLASALWAGPEKFSRAMLVGDEPVQGVVRSGPVSLRMGWASEDYGYAIDLGLPMPSRSMFRHDPEIKLESVWTGNMLGRANSFAERKGPMVRIRDDAGRWAEVTTGLAATDSMMTHCADPRQAPELLVLREQFRAWRFYDSLRTDRDAPVRQPHIGHFTPVLASDGGDLASAIQTIIEVGDRDGLAETIDDAFPGTQLAVTEVAGQLQLEVQQPGLLRPLGTAELSDGTLRYLMLAAILLSPRPPALLILNEPEASLHSDLLPPLGRLIGAAAVRSQIIVVSHAEALAHALHDARAVAHVRLEKRLGETIVADTEPADWVWPTR